MLFHLLNFLIFNCYDAHISMNHPIPRKSKLSEYYRNTNNVNYDLRSPLYADFNKFTFPCKGFPVGPSITTYNSNSISVTLEGTATHGGGHCQFGISYDNKNFLVFKTVLNSCLLDSMSYTFNLPNNTPGGNLIVFWTWINRIGNREYYMDCADVTVNNGISGSANVMGKELVVANILNYPIIPEWQLGAPESIDGRYLFKKVKDFSLTVNSNNITIPITTSIPVTSLTIASLTTASLTTASLTTASSTAFPTSTKTKNLKNDCDMFKCNSEGLMVCFEDGFYTCTNKKWIFRPCSIGTKCKQSGTFILCDYK